MNFRLRWANNILSHAQVGVYTWDLRLDDSLWEGREPAFWLPLQRVLAPDGLVAVRGENAHNDSGVLGHKDLVNHLAVETLHGLREW